MDRVISYDAEVPAVLDILNTGKKTLVGLSFHNAAMFGTSTVQSASYAVTGPVMQGLACTPTTPTASMNINIAPGQIFVNDTVDATAYGDLGTDANIIYKQGILYNTKTLTVAPPALTSGQSVNILVEVELQDVDGGSEVVQYFSGTPAVLWGSNFAATQALGTPQNTIRKNPCNVQLKNGTAATTGSQTTPTPDSGYTGLYVITVPVGYSAILSTYITSYQTGTVANGADQELSLPFFPTLPEIPPNVQTSAWTAQPDTGTVNAMAATCYPLVTSLVAGQLAYIKAANTNTGATTFNLNGIAAKDVHRASGVPLSSGDITSGQQVWMIYDGEAWQIVNFYGPIHVAQTNFYNTFSVAYGTDHGTPNNIVVSPNPPIASWVAGQVLAVKVANNNTGPTTLMLAGQAASVPVLENQLPLQNEAITVGEIIFLEYDGANLQKQPQRWPYYPYDVSTEGASKQYLAVNDQAQITFESVTAVPLNIACVPGVYSIELVASMNNSSQADLWLLPNDTATGSFQSWQNGNTAMIEDSDLPSPEAWPQARIVPSSAFAISMAFQRGGGPLMIAIDASTLTAAKMVQYLAGMANGVPQGFSIWNDTTTAWTSLGTLLVSLSGGMMSPAATLTGVAIVRRLA